MQINSASLLAAQQARTQTAMPQQRTAAAKTQADELFEPLFGKSEVKAASSSPSTPNAAPAKFTRPGSQIDIRV
jgi:hypothetical protein